jgi:hypothetical protein
MATWKKKFDTFETLDAMKKARPPPPASSKNRSLAWFDLWIDMAVLSLTHPHHATHGVFPPKYTD